MKMKRGLMITAALIGMTTVHAQEVTSSGNLQTETSWNALKTKIEATDSRLKIVQIQLDRSLLCGNKGMAYGPDNAAKDGDGCVATGGNSFEIGTLNDGATYNSTVRNYTVKFKQPFTAAPKVYVALNNFQYQNDCTVDDFRVDIGVSNITQTQFTLTLNGKKAGCSNWILRGVTWIAVTP
jgi:H-type lectin domain